MHPRFELPEDLRRRPFLVSEARTAGFTRSQLRTAAVRAPFRGVRVPADLPDNLYVRCWALSLLLPPAARFDGVTAAALHELPLPRLVKGDDPIVIRVPSGSVAPRIHGVRVHQTTGLEGARPAPPDRVVTVAVPAMWSRLVRDQRLVDDDLVVLCDAIRYRFAANLSSEPFGTPWARKRHSMAWHLSRSGINSPQETRLRLAFHAGGLPEPELNHDVFDEGGQWVARPDFAWPEQMLAVEYDSARHRTDRRQWEQDVQRKRLMERLGWRVIIVTAADTRKGTHHVVDEVREALRRLRKVQ